MLSDEHIRPLQIPTVLYGSDKKVCSTMFSIHNSQNDNDSTPMTSSSYFERTIKRYRSTIFSADQSYE